MNIQWLKPKGFWGYLGIAISFLLIVAIATQYIWHPYVVLNAAEVEQVDFMLQQLYMQAIYYKQQCLPS